MIYTLYKTRRRAWTCRCSRMAAQHGRPSVMREEPLPWSSYACAAPPREIDLGAAGRLAGRPQLRRRFRQPPVQRCLIGDPLVMCRLYEKSAD